jgi:hypothetical protein
MKTFINKKTDITMSQEDPTKLGYSNLAIIGLNTPPQGGWTPDEMRQRIKVIAKLDDKDIGAKIKLEDAEFDLVVKCANIKWQFMHKDVVAFDDYLSELKKE